MKCSKCQKLFMDNQLNVFKVLAKDKVIKKVLCDECLGDFAVQIAETFIEKVKRGFSIDLTFLK